MYYPRFTKVIVDYFMAKDQGIPRRNKMFWHYARDDFMFTTVRVISKHQDTQVYGAILPQHLTNQAMLESEAYMTYRAYATGEKTPKPKTTKKKADSESSPKTKSTQASKGKRITTLAKGDKPAKKKQSASKSKGLTVLSEVALTEAQQMKIAIERSKIQTHSSHASGFGASDKPEVLDVPEYRSKSEEESWTYSQGEDDEDNDEHDSENNNDDEDDDQENVSGETELDNNGDDFVHPNLSTYKADDQEEEKEEEKANDDEDVSSNQMVSTPPNYEITEEEENQEDDDDVMGREQEDEELYGALNLNLDRRDAEMTDAQNNQETEEHKQTNQFAKALSSILGIVDNYLVSKMKGAINVAVQLKSNKLREEAQAENDEFLKQIDSNIKAIIKDQVKAQVSKIMPKVEKYVTESLGAEDLFASYGDVVTLKRGRDDQDKDEEPSTRSNRGKKRRRPGKEESSKEITQKESKSTSSSKGASRSQAKSSGKSAQAEEHGPRVDDLEEPLHQEFNTGNDDISHVREIIAVDERLWNPSGSQTPDREWNKTKTNARGRQVIPFDHFINNDLEYLKGGSLSQKYTTSLTKTKATDYGHVKWIEDKRFYGYANNMETSKDVYSRHMIIVVTSLKIMEFFGYKHLEEITVRRQDDQLYMFREGNFKRLRRQDIEDMLLLLVQERVEDLQLAVESYQKKINLSKPDSYRLDLRKMTPYTDYHDIQGIIYQDDMDKNRLMRTDEFYKFSDGTLNHVRTALNDIATGIQMEYLPKRKWSKQDKQRARVMIDSIDKKLRDRRLMRSQEFLKASHVGSSYLCGVAMTLL
ncbi:hypothetical protein Tco_0348629 [Tanacetum coccineum]